MPTVRTFRREQDLRPLPAVRRSYQQVGQVATPLITAHPSAETYGAQLGQTISQVGSAFLQRAQELELRDDVIAAQAADRGLAIWELQALDEPERGLLATTRGKDARNLLKTVPEEFGKVRAKAWQGLENDRQREEFTRLADERELTLSRKLGIFVAKEQESYAIAEIQAGIKVRQLAAVTNAGDLQRVGEEIQGIRDLIADETALNGLGPQYQNMATLAAVSKAHAGVIDALLVRGQALPAQEYYNDFSKELIADEQTRVKTKLDVATTDSLGMLAADEIFKAIGPKSDAAAASLDELLQAARKVFPDDAAKYKATAEFLKERVSSFNAGREQRADAAERIVWDAVDQGATLEEVGRMREYLTLLGDRRIAVRKAIEDRLHTLEERANGREMWLWTQEQHVHTRAEQAEQALTKRAYGRYLELSNPARLVQMSEDQIRNLLPSLGQTLTGQLMQDRRSLKTGQNVIDATIDEDVFNALAQGAGLRPYAKADQRNETENGRLGMLRYRVKTVIDVEQRAKGRELNRQEKESVIKREIDDKIKLSIPWYKAGPSELQLPSGAVLPGEAPLAGEPLAGVRIPQGNLQPALNFLRSIGVVPPTMSDAQAARLYRDRLERAYAASQAGQPDEAVRILRGP